MIKSLLKIAVLVVIGVLVYNYFFGDPDEKATSEKVFNEIKDVGVAVKDFVKDEHQRIKDGKYKKVISKIDDTLTGIEAKIKNMDKETVEEYKNLRRESKRLEGELKDLKEDSSDELSKEERKSIESKLKDLLEKTNDFIKENVKEEE